MVAFCMILNLTIFNNYAEKKKIQDRNFGSFRCLYNSPGLPFTSYFSQVCIPRENVYVQSSTIQIYWYPTHIYQVIKTIGGTFA